MNEAVLSLLVLYDSPGDVPGRWVVREQRAIRGGDIWLAPVAFVFPSLGHALDWLESTGLSRLSRHRGDDPVIVGVWI